MPSMHVAFTARRRLVVLVFAAGVVAAGCSAVATPIVGPSSPGAGGASPVSSGPGGRPSDLPRLTPPPGTLPVMSPPTTGEAPAPIVDAARTDLAGRIGETAAAAATVVRSEAVSWPDGSLGCRVPGLLYPQVVTPGYRIVFTTDGTRYDYRATQAGAVRLCEHPGAGR
jgi:hypothetical protein